MSVTYQAVCVNKDEFARISSGIHDTSNKHCGHLRKGALVIIFVRFLVRTGIVLSRQSRHGK